MEPRKAGPVAPTLLRGIPLGEICVMLDFILDKYFLQIY